MRFKQLMIAVAGVLFVLINTSFSQRTSAKEEPLHLIWDLTYAQILEKNNVASNELIRKWLKMYDKSPARGWLANWKNEPIVSSVLIEHPAFHAGERTTMWFFRTKSGAQYWVSVQEEDDSISEIAADSHRFTLTPAIYDIFLKTISAWQQKNPPKPATLPDQAIPGFMGIISIYSDGAARQVLVTFEDFFSCESQKCPEPKPGRLSCALTAVVVDSVKEEVHANYKALCAPQTKPTF